MKLFLNIKYLSIIFLFFMQNFEVMGGVEKATDRNSYEVVDIGLVKMSPPNSYNLNVGLIVGTLYVLSCPSLDRDDSAICEAVNNISAYLDEDGDVIQCMRTLGEVMVRQGKQNFNFNNAVQEQVHQNAMDMANDVGLGEHADTFADRVIVGMRNEQLQPIIIGRELIWLSNVLSDAAEGDWHDYDNTGSFYRKTAQAQINQIKNTLILYGQYDRQLLELLGVVLPVVAEWSTQYGIGYIVGVGIYNGVIE